jgi:heme/copper-type cytochrome/quinol oxidase subunit 2
MKKLLTLVLVAAVLFGVFGTMLAKARAQEPDGGDHDQEPPEHQEPGDNENTGVDNHAGGTGGGVSITSIAVVLIVVIVVVAVLVALFRRAASSQSMESF